MNEDSNALPTRERQLATIERSLRESERRLSTLAERGQASTLLLDELERRIAQARADHDRLSRRADARQVTDVAEHLARWIGNCDSPPPPRRLPQRPLGDARRSD